MELTHRDYKVSKFEDVISSMPDNVLTNIMDRLPLQEEVRTSILSRNWRFKWTMLSQLVLDGNFFKYLSVTKGEKEHGLIITRLLLHLKDTVTKFVLSMGMHSCSVSDQDINHWILFLSEKRLKDLTLLNLNETLIKLPTHLFSCLELKHLKLSGCVFIDPPVTFHCFPNLLSLELRNVQSDSRFGQFISRCPALEILKIGFMYSVDIEEGILKLVDIAKLANLKILSLPLRVLGDIKITSSNRLFELVGSFPKLEELDLAFGNCKLTEGDDAEKTPPTTFPCLRALRLYDVDIGNEIMLSCVIGMIRRSLNLQKLGISALEHDVIPAQPTLAICSREANYNTRGLLQLQNASFVNVSENKNDVHLIKYVLACSPSLRQIVIYPDPYLSSDEKFTLAKKLLALQRSSPNAKVYI